MATRDRVYALQKPGDVVLIGSNDLHRTTSFRNEPLVRLVIQINLPAFLSQATLNYVAFFSETTGSLSELNHLIEGDIEIQRILGKILVGIHQEMEKAECGYELVVGADVNRLVGLLVNHDERFVHESQHDINKLRPVLQYISDHLTEDIHVSDACRLVNYNYHYFLRLFKRTMGVSFKEYINRSRIKMAERLLLTQEDNVSEIGYQSGFGTLDHFFRLFKRYNNCSPGDFRRKMNELHIEK